MEDVICSCSTANSCDNEVCSKCGEGLKGDCATCNYRENITFVKAGVCQGHILDDCEEIKEKFQILLKPIYWRFNVMCIGSIILGILVFFAFDYLLPPMSYKLLAGICVGVTISAMSLCFICLWVYEKVHDFRQTLIANYKKSNPTEAELLEKVGWKIL